MPHQSSPSTDSRLADHSDRTWQRMLSGRRLNLVEPSPMDIEIEDIAIGLARNARWNGQTKGPHAWSVAQHSDLVVEIVRRERPRASARLLMAAKLHDASEYVTHDLITPLKAAVGEVFKEVETRLMRAIHIRFGLPPVLTSEFRTLIKRADRIAAATEAVQLAGFSEAECRSYLKFKEKPMKSAKLVPLPVAEAERKFLEGFRKLENAMRLEAR